MRPIAAGLFPGRREAQSLSHGEGLSAHDCLWPGALAPGLHRGGQCGSLDPVLWRVSMRCLAAGVVLSGQRGPHRWLRQHDQESADPVPWGTPRELLAPRTHQTPEETRGHHVPAPQGAPHPVPHPVVPGTTAQRLTRVCPGPAVAPLRGPRHRHRGASQWRARATLGAGQEGGLVCGPRGPADARHEHPARSGP
jgi:hypothetical protein